MESFNDFLNRNRNWDNGSILVTDDEMRNNYRIACEVEERYVRRYGHIGGPRIGDIVEFTDGWHVYKCAKIVESMYDNDKVCICENGSSFTDGKHFSTGGGAFVSKEASELKFVGHDVNIVWTWGCNGSGANQGIHFPLKVRRWIIPYDNKDVKRSIVHFQRDRDNNVTGVRIENSDSIMCCVMDFCSLDAFKAWANYVGYNYRMRNDGRGESSQKIVEKCWTEEAQKPQNGKPIKVLGNGQIHDGIVVSEEFTITQWWPNIATSYPSINTPEGKAAADKRIELFRKYARNPMGI